MIVFLPKQLKTTGGSSSFARKFQQGFKELGHTVAFTSPAEYDVLLVSPKASLRFLVAAKLRGKKIIQRLDGVYYPETVAGWLFPLYNLPLTLINWLFADMTIFQSKYSRRICRLFLRIPVNKNTALIYNGVDTYQFFPAPEEEDQQKIMPRFVTTGRFRHREQIIPLLKAWQIFQVKYGPAELQFIGNFEGALKDLPSAHQLEAGLTFTGPLPNDQLPTYLRQADVFLITHLNPPCPNNVIEALACGLPVCGVADGAMPELIENGRSGELIEPISGGYFRPRRINEAELADRIYQVLQNRPAYAALARRTAEEKFSLKKMSQSYAENCQRIIA